MMLIEARCPTCHAPLPLTGEPIITCRYCGTSLRDPSARPLGQTRTMWAVTIERVGPSNRARIAHLLRTGAGIPASDAERLVTTAPCEVVVWDDAVRAEALRDQLTE